MSEMFIAVEITSQTADLWWSFVGLIVGWAGGFSLGYYMGMKKR